MADKPTRCAIYTRKSTEEGLDQEFNSLDAQREACGAYILSQKHEGWSQVPGYYDDGGYSGGNLDRPGLKQVLAEVAAGNIDVIVVYKVDRLTRSLADFAKIVEVLDKAGASFVSVTQSFNTTTSMGRLTLNVLLSFAQFEREVTGERIRDKVAASKRKGMWMGGVVPIGYDVVSRKLVINDTDAEVVRRIFNRYLELRSTGDLADELAGEGVTSKVRSIASADRRGGRPFSRGALSHLLQNRVYVGEIGHKGQHFPGEHQPIIEQELFDQVQEVMRDNKVERKVTSRAAVPSLLAGMISDAEGRPMTPSHANRGTRRYRYYITAPQTPGGKATPDGWRIPAGEIEQLVQARLSAWLTDEAQLYSTIGGIVQEDRLRWLVDDCSQLGQQIAAWSPDKLRGLLLTLEARTAIAFDHIALSISVSKLIEHLGDPAVPGFQAAHTIIIPASFVRRGQELRLAYRANDDGVPTRADPRLIELLGRAELAYEELLSGDPIASVRRPHLSRLARLKFLAPDIVSGILKGRQPTSMTARSLLRAANLPGDWAGQREVLGFAA